MRKLLNRLPLSSIAYFNPGWLPEIRISSMLTICAFRNLAQQSINSSNSKRIEPKNKITLQLKSYSDHA